MTPEFSRPVRVDRIPASGTVREIAAREGERRALAERFGIVSIESLSARVALRRAGEDDVAVTAHFAARVVQECVVTLDPVAGDIEEEVALLFRPVGREELDRKTVVIPRRRGLRAVRRRHARYRRGRRRRARALPRSVSPVAGRGRRARRGSFARTRRFTVSRAGGTGRKRLDFAFACRPPGSRLGIRAIPFDNLNQRRWRWPYRRRKCPSPAATSGVRTMR